MTPGRCGQLGATAANLENPSRKSLLRWAQIETVSMVPLIIFIIFPPPPPPLPSSRRQAKQI